MKAAFLKTIDEHQKILHKVCHLYTNTSEDREDLFQEIVIQLWKSIDQFREDSKISTWMYKVALHTAITHLNKAKKQLNNIDGIIESINYRKLPDIYNEDDFSLLNKAIGELNKTDKALTLLYLEKHSYQEIAKVMGLSESNVGVKINRIKSKLKTIMKSKNG